MNYNTQNAKIASITDKTLIVGIDVGSETHYARAFDWRNFEFTIPGCVSVEALRMELKRRGEEPTGYHDT